MAFEVPKIERLSPQPTPSVGREQVSVPNFAAATAPQAAASEKLVESGANDYVKYVKQVADTEGLRASNEMDRYLIDALDGDNGAKRQKGNPYEIYNNFDTNEEKKFQEIRDRYADASSETKAEVERRLMDTRAKFYDRKVSARGVQINAYEDDITNDSVDLKKNDMMDAVSHLDINDPHATTKLDAVIGDIQNLRLTRGLKNGSVKEIHDEQGNVVGYDMQPGVKLQIAKDTSDGLYQTISNLAKSGDVNGAKFLSEKYSIYLDARNKEKTTEVLQKEGVESDALNWTQKLRTLPEEQALREASKIDNPKVAEKTMAKLHTFYRQIEIAKDHSAKENFKKSFDIVDQAQRAGTPFPTVDKMMSNDRISQMWQYMTPKQRETLKHMVDQPKESDEKVKSKMYEALQNGSLAKMSWDEANTAMSGLSKKDRSMFETQYRNATTQTAGEEHQRIQFATKNVRDALFTVGYVDRNAFLKFEDEAQRKINTATDEFLDHMQAFPKNMSYNDLRKEIKDFAATKIKNEAFNPSPAATPKVRDFSGSTKNAQTAPIDTASAPAVGGVGQRDRRDAMRVLKKPNPSKPGEFIWPTEDQIQNYLKGK